MSNVIDFKRKRARLGAGDKIAPQNRRARPTRPEGGPGFVTIGAISAEIVRRLKEE